MKRRNETTPIYKVLTAVSFAIIALLVWYIRDKNRIDYNLQKEISQTAKEKALDYYASGIADLKAVYKGEKDYFG